jgi:hypothetical protein
MARTQMRLDALTGSLSSAENHVESLDAGSLQDVMDHLASGIKRLHGGSAYYSQEAGRFSQDIHMDSELRVDQGAIVSVHLHGSGTLTAEGAADLRSTLSVTGESTLASATISDITAQHVMFAGTAGAVEGAADLKWDGAKVLVGGGFGSTGMDLGADGALSMDGALRVDGAADLNSSLDVAGAVFLGASGGSADTQIRGDLSVGEDATISGDLTVTGDFRVNGALTYVDTTNLVVADAKIVVSSGSLVDGAGLYLGNDDSGENLRWSTADGGKWIASDKFAADTMQALDLSEAIVWADASGNLMELAASDFGAYLTAGAGIDSVADGQIDATPYIAGTGVTITAFTASIGQPVGTSDNVIFADISADSVKLADFSGDAGKAYKVGTDGAVVPAAWDEFVSIEADVGLEISHVGFKAHLDLAQDIRTSATVQFDRLQLDGANNYVDSDGGGLVLHASLTGDSIKFEYDNGKSISLGTDSLVGFAATDIMAALNELKSTATTFAKYVREPGAQASGSPIQVNPSFAHDIPSADSRIDVFVNGQLLRKTEDYAYDGDSDKLVFQFDIEVDDVLSVIVR